MLISLGKFPEAIGEYAEAIARNPTVDPTNALPSLTLLP